MIALTSVYFSLALDESTNESDVSQLLICIRAVDNEFAITGEVFDVCALHGTTKGEDIFKAVQTSVQKIGGFTTIACYNRRTPSVITLTKDYTIIMF